MIFQIAGGKLSLFIPRNSIVTLSTIATANKGEAGQIPKSKPFPSIYKEDFESKMNFNKICLRLKIKWRASGK